MCKSLFPSWYDTCNPILVGIFDEPVTLLVILILEAVLRKLPIHVFCPYNASVLLELENLYSPDRTMTHRELNIEYESNLFSYSDVSEVYVRTYIHTLHTYIHKYIHIHTCAGIQLSKHNVFVIR
jgi:hypothetical protein